MVTFQVKVSRRQTGRMYSKNTRLPALGARGRIRLAGVAIRVDRQAHSAAPVVQATAASTAPKSKLAAAPHVSTTIPLTDGPNAMPHVAPAFIQVIASVMRLPGTARSHVAFAVISMGA